MKAAQRHKRDVSTLPCSISSSNHLHTQHSTTVAEVCSMTSAPTQALPDSSMIFRVCKVQLTQPRHWLN